MRAQDKHDPGGLVRLKLPDGITGNARFSDCGRYRQWLTRDWTPAEETPRSILFCGMNPSTADADVSDPTVARETTFAKDWGFTRYLKANVLDWRSTSPKDLPKELDLARSPDNLPEIARMAAEVDEIIVAHGKMPKHYQQAIDDIVEVFRNSGKPLFCLGRNADGSAKHPLYLARTTQRIPY